jgi:signal transduction histidine kinase
MNAILGFAQLLALDNLSENQKDSVQHIITAGHHLMDLINQVLDLAKIEADKLELNLEEISLTYLIQNCLSLVQPLTLKNQIKLIDNSGMGHHTLVIVDKLRFKQVLLNLISNAIKYNRTAGSVTITTALVQPQRLRISITDTGNGLSKEQIDKLFQPFERLTAKNSQIEGTGIGLCISKKLIEAMDGRIGVESEEGEGSCFWIEIPSA